MALNPRPSPRVPPLLHDLLQCISKEGSYLLESTVLLKVLAACEVTVATVLHDHHSGLANTNWTQDQTASGSASTDRTQDQTASGARANASTSPDVDPRTPSLSSENVEPREPRPQRHGGQLSRWERIRNSWH
jgi:hypothetical protein